MKSREYIKEFQKITVNRICQDLNISKTNISRGNAKDILYDNIKEEIESRIAKLYIKR